MTDLSGPSYAYLAPLNPCSVEAGGWRHSRALAHRSRQALAIIGLAVFGLVHRAATRRSGLVTVYLKLDATPSQTARVLAAVKREDGVSEVTLITKKAAFAKLKRRYPWLVERPSLSALPLEA